MDGRPQRRRLIVPTVLSLTVVGATAIAIVTGACHHSTKPVADARGDGGPPVDAPLV